MLKLSEHVKLNMVSASSEFLIRTLKIERVLMSLFCPMYGEHGPDSTGFFGRDLLYSTPASQVMITAPNASSASVKYQLSQVLIRYFLKVLIKDSLPFDVYDNVRAHQLLSSC